MTPLTLRLARPYLLASTGLIAAVALYAVLTRHAMTTNLDASGPNARLASGGDCQALAGTSRASARRGQLLSVDRFRAVAHRHVLGRSVDCPGDRLRPAEREVFDFETSR
jgi:hypothetical protein